MKFLWISWCSKPAAVEVRRAEAEAPESLADAELTPLPTPPRSLTHKSLLATRWQTRPPQQGSSEDETRELLHHPDKLPEFVYSSPQEPCNKTTSSEDSDLGPGLGWSLVKPVLSARTGRRFARPVSPSSGLSPDSGSRIEDSMASDLVSTPLGTLSAASDSSAYEVARRGEEHSGSSSSSSDDDDNGCCFEGNAQRGTKTHTGPIVIVGPPTQRHRNAWRQQSRSQCQSRPLSRPYTRPHSRTPVDGGGSSGSRCSALVVGTPRTSPEFVATARYPPTAHSTGRASGNRVRRHAGTIVGAGVHLDSPQNGDSSFSSFILQQHCHEHATASGGSDGSQLRSKGVEAALRQKEQNLKFLRSTRPHSEISPGEAPDQLAHTAAVAQLHSFSSRRMQRGHHGESRELQTATSGAAVSDEGLVRYETPVSGRRNYRRSSLRLRTVAGCAGGSLHTVSFAAQPIELPMGKLPHAGSKHPSWTTNSTHVVTGQTHRGDFTEENCSSRISRSASSGRSSASDNPRPKLRILHDPSKKVTPPASSQRLSTRDCVNLRTQRSARR